MTLKIIYEDNHLIAVEKPPGMLTQQDHSGTPSLMDHVKDYLKEAYSKPGNVYLGMVHRLDRPVSGVILFARTSKGASRLSEQFRTGKTEKFYLALTAPSLKQIPGSWVYAEDYLTRDHDKTITGKIPGKISQKAELEYCVLESSPDHELLLIRLITGRKHQIRAQLSARGFPITGDTKYGSSAALPRGQILLHASRLIVSHPTTGERLVLKSSVYPFFGPKYSPFTDIESKIDGIISEFLHKI